MTNASDPKSVATAKRREKDRDEQRDADLKALLKLAEFRRYIWRHIAQTCQLMQSPGSSNGSIQSTNIGRQDVARELWAEIERADPLAIPRMMTEHFESQRADA